jgi:hypothetical protein
MPGGEPETFDELLRHELRRAPWLVISIAFHFILYLILHNLVFTSVEHREEKILQAEALDENIEPIVEEPPPPPPEEPEELEEELEDPEISEQTVEDLVDEQDNRTPLDSPFNSRNLNDVIGAGGGAGGGFGGKYGRRGTGKGGGKASQKAVEAGLEWLKNHQDPDGFWDCDDFSDQCRTNICDGKGNALNDVGVTGIALLAFLGAGNTMSTGKYRDVVKNGLKYLQKEQDRDDGCFGPKSGPHFIYNHALAALAMVEGYHLSRQPLLKGPAQKGLDFIARARNPYKAWRYDYPPSGDNDVSISGWCLFALFAGQDGDLKVDDNAIKDGMAYIDEMTDPNTWRTGYRERGSHPAREEGDADIWPPERSESMTAVALLLRFFNHEDPDQSEAMKGAADLLTLRLPTWDEASGDIDFYYWYYGSYALWQFSGRPWDQWQKKLLDSVVEHQRQDGDEKGSWDPQVDPWGDSGGRVYSTAINTLSLEVYYRYDKVFGSR